MEREKTQLRSGLRQILMHYHKACRDERKEYAMMETVSMAFNELLKFGIEGKEEDVVTSVAVDYMLKLSVKRLADLKKQENITPEVLEDWQAFVEWLKGMQQYLPKR